MNNRRIKKGSWTDLVAKAIKNNGGEATLPDMYQTAVEADMELPAYKEKIRATARRKFTRLKRGVYTM